MGRFIDLTGQRFGMLVVTRRAESKVDKNGKICKTMWYCDCDCGNKDVPIAGGNLKSGNTKTCGCQRAKTMHDNMKKYNRFEFKDDYVVGYTSNNDEFIFDISDYEKIKDICWYKAEDESICGHSNGETLYFHRFVMNVTETKIQVDHRNHKRNDNRKSNLRVANNSQNGMNKGLRSDNTSGVTGVRFEKDRGKWGAFISIDGKSTRIGSFTNKQDAIAARKQEEEMYYKEFSYDNSMKQAEQYAIN